MGKYTDGGFLLVYRKLLQKLLREFHRQQKFSGPVCKPTGGVGMTVSIGNIGFVQMDIYLRLWICLQADIRKILHLFIVPMMVERLGTM